MLSLHFAIIIDDQIRFLSQPDFYAQFEMAIFANLLIRQIAEDRPWSLHQICFQKISDLQPSRLLVKRYLCTESSKDILFCIIGQIKHDICAATRWLDEFTNACLQEYPLSILEFFEVLNLEKFQIDCLKILNTFQYTEENCSENDGLEDNFIGKNQMVYAGISSSGLPIAQQLYGHQSIFAIDSPTKKDIITTILSGQLATIVMNSLIRAQSRIKTIEIKISDTENRFMVLGFQDFGVANTYTLEMLYSGNIRLLDTLAPKILLFLEKSSMFNEPFTGSKKGFSPIQKYLEDLESVFEDLDEII